MFALVGLVCSCDEVTADPVASPDTLLQFRTRSVSGGRIDLDDHIWRAKYGLDRITPSLSSKALLREESAAFGWPKTLDDLRLVSDRRLPRSRHVTYQQTHHGIDVYGRTVRVNENGSGEPTMILSGYKPIRDDAPFDPVPSIGADDAEKIALNVSAPGGGVSEVRNLVVYAVEAPVLAWHVVVWPDEEPAEYVVLVDAGTGDVLAAFDQAVRRRDRGDGVPSGESAKPVETNAKPMDTSAKPMDTSAKPAPAEPPAGAPVTRRPENPGAPVRTTGSGYVFDPDPLSSVGVPYGAPYDDSNDATTPELDAARVLASLHDISVNGIGLYVLEGPHVKIIGENQAGTTTYSPPRGNGPDEFRFTRDISGFEAVNAYYHLDQSQRYVQSLGITDLLNEPFPVNPRGVDRDDSFFFPDRNMLLFGTGGVDDAEDASVLWHEYAHGLMEDGAPGLLSTLEGASLHEGWADYWAASYLRYLAESGATVQQDWTQLFRWDSGEGFIWAGRALDHDGHYPEDTCVDDPNPGFCNKHHDGTLWATTLMEVYTDLGRVIIDELTLRSLGYLSAPTTFRDAAEAVVQADLDYFAGSHVDVLLSRFGARGLLDPGAYAPVIYHDQLSWTEFTGGTRSISADVAGLSSPVDRVSVHYRTTSGDWMELTLTAGLDDLFQGDLPLPVQADTVFYYFEAVDTGGLTAFLPESAPVETFHFGIGVDTEAPVITHEPEVRVALSAWPATIEARVTDNVGISRVEVTYRINNNFATVLAEGQFEMTGSNDIYSGVLPVESSVLESNNQVLYSIEATDASAAGNTTRMPETGYYLMSVDAEGLFRTFDFEAISPLVEATGTWDQGVPRFGLQAAHSGEMVFGTSTGSAYPSAAGLSTLDFASVNLSGVSGAMLVFWHWYDFEHDGAADPYVNGAQLWDGGNVKVSTDGGQTWDLLLPEGHYSGDVIVSQDNPLSGQRAFGGYSYGWRQAIMPLPEASDVRIRFDMGTDESNTQDARWYAGWYIDDVSVTTIRPEDSAPPTAVTLPPASSVLSIDEPMPTVEVALTDDNGVADAYYRYEYTRSNGGISDGRFRIEMLPTGLLTFAGTFDFIRSPSPGDRLKYRVMANDHAGNEVIFPPPADEPFEIEYRLVQSTRLVSSATGSGVWERSGDGWTATLEIPTFNLSSINLATIDLPDNSRDLSLEISHRYRLGDSLGGNVKLSPDGGWSWLLLDPGGDYASTLDLGNHPMDGEDGFSGLQASPQTSRFSLDSYAGEQIRLRIDFASTRPLEGNEFWVIESIELIQSTDEEGFDVPRMFALHNNYPNPFRVSTSVGFSIDETGPIELALFDVLGRRVMDLASGIYEPGTYEMTLSASNLTSGVYLLRLVANGRRLDRTVVVAK